MMSLRLPFPRAVSRRAPDGEAPLLARPGPCVPAPRRKAAREPHALIAAHALRLCTPPDAPRGAEDEEARKKKEARPSLMRPAPLIRPLCHHAHRVTAPAHAPDHPA